MKTNKPEENERESSETEKETDTRPVSEMKEQASEIEDRMMEYCLDPTKKVNKDQTATIMRYFKDMRSIVEELLRHNSYLFGRLEQSSGEEHKKGKAILNAVNRSLQASKRLEVAVTKRAQTEERPLSYAEKVNMTSKKVAPKAVQPPKNVVIIRPETDQGKIKTSEEAREAVFTLVNPRKKGIQVAAVRNISGNGLAVETTNAEGLKAFTNNDKLKEAGLKASTPQRRHPRMILYDVPRDISEEEIRTCLKKQNRDRFTEEDVAAIKFCFRTGRKDQTETNWIMEVPPCVRTKLLLGKLYISWNACKVRDYLAISRCYKCQNYGHVAKYCRVPHDISTHCAESGHATKECPNKAKHPSCVNCKKAGKKGDHAASNANCPMHKKALELLTARTSYE